MLEPKAPARNGPNTGSLAPGVRERVNKKKAFQLDITKCGQQIENQIDRDTKRWTEATFTRHKSQRIRRGKMFNSKTLLLFLGCEMQFWVSCFHCQTNAPKVSYL